MASPYQWPWVEFIRVPTPNIDSTPVIIFGNQVTGLIDNIQLCNTTDQDIFVDISVLTERDLVVETTYIRTKLFIPKFGSIGVLEKPEIMQPGDLMYANSDFSGNRFDCTISGRLLLETAGVLSARNSRR